VLVRGLRPQVLQLLVMHSQMEVAIADDQLAYRHRAIPHDLAPVPDSHRNLALPFRASCQLAVKDA